MTEKATVPLEVLVGQTEQHRSTRRSNREPRVYVYGHLYPPDGVTGAPVELPFLDDGRIEVSIDASRVQAVIVGGSLLAEAISASDFRTVMNAVEEFVQGFVDMVGFQTGATRTFCIDGAFSDAGGPIQIRRHIWPEAFGIDGDAIRKAPGDKLIPALIAASAVPLLRVALADISSALRRPHDTAFYAYRAIESVREYLQRKHKRSKKKAGWELVRTECSIDASDLNRVTELAANRRHGAALQISEADRLLSISIAVKAVRAMLNDLVENASTSR